MKASTFLQNVLKESRLTDHRSVIPTTFGYPVVLL